MTHLTRYVLFSALGLIAAAILFILLVNLRDVHRKENLFQNGKRLYRVAQLLEAERPFPLATVRSVLTRHLGSDGLNDAWGRPFEIAIRQAPSGGSHYIIRSLGADGSEGPCFATPFPKDYDYDPDCDWVAVDGLLVPQYPKEPSRRGVT